MKFRHTICQKFPLLHFFFLILFLFFFACVCSKKAFRICIIKIITEKKGCDGEIVVVMLKFVNELNFLENVNTSTPNIVKYYLFRVELYNGQKKKEMLVFKL